MADIKSRKFPCPSIQRLSCKQKNCIRPCNAGDTAIGAVNERERDFDNFFNPFSKQYNKVNFVCKPKNNKTRFPVADRGSGALGKVKKCRTGPDCQCSLDGNQNNNTINKFEAGERKFEDQFNSMTKLYLKTNTVCRDYNTKGVPIANRGTGAPNACKIGSRSRPRGQCRQLDNNNVASDFCRQELAFDNAIRQSQKCRR